MADWWFAALVVVLWLAVGLGCAAVFVTRGGHRNLLWYLVGGLLGPLFVPIAVERGKARTRQLDVRSQPAVPTGRGLRVLVGVDGSTHSDRALHAVARTLAGSVSELVLATVTSVDLTEDESREEHAQARRLLDERVTALPRALPRPTTLIVAGHPVDALLTVADDHDVDLLVVGRHGHGVSDRLLGSVAQELAHRSPRAVLLSSLADR
ncbi:Nucleotide-binding universal stress protein, UspA family [Micromonospora nigra]|uniref:Nucleotide-binding universal stress protein, UspA family n=1 Tax=Micromonospora nigra TaxID=145857 RepID=A0A1C6S745_9ACTN|nr:universal stress protein [Micromonospora nigra]SCL25265.1 Nucleotide-binding universal stress protein, UspA family [Micromonospora nigra]